MTMLFHAPTGRYVLPADAIKRTAHELWYALRQIRETAKQPLDASDTRPGPLRPHDFAQIAVLQAAEAIGIDLGVPAVNFFKLDLRKELP